MNEQELEKLEDFTEFVLDRLVDIAQRVPPEAKLTILIRIPGNDDADCVITNDEINDIAALVERTKARKLAKLDENLEEKHNEKQ